MNAATVAAAIGGRKAGGGWIARCPAHDDREPSLSICDADDGGILVHCFAGCVQSAVIEALQAKGLWTAAEPRHPPDATRRSGSAARDDRSSADRTRAALGLWRASGPAAATPVEAYLRSRGFTRALPATLRFRAGLKHPSDGTWPAMVALVTRGEDDTPLAIHRTFLARDGAGKAPVKPQKMMLGPCRGGAVRLATAADLLMVGEGIESCLAALQATGKPAWAALSTAGLRALELPDPVRNVIVLADGDDPGEAAARDCAWRWQREGRRVRIARPPRGQDFNDLLTGTVPCDREGWK